MVIEQPYLVSGALYYACADHHVLRIPGEPQIELLGDLRRAFGSPENLAHFFWSYKGYICNTIGSNVTEYRSVISHWDLRPILALQNKFCLGEHPIALLEHLKERHRAPITSALLIRDGLHVSVYLSISYFVVTHYAYSVTFMKRSYGPNVITSALYHRRH